MPKQTHLQAYEEARSLSPELGDLHPEALKMDGYDDCIIGTCSQFGRPPVVAYDYDAVIAKIMIDCEYDWNEAVEFHEFNQVGAWVGEFTPVFISLMRHVTVSPSVKESVVVEGRDPA